MTQARPHITVEQLRIGWGSRVLMEHVSFTVKRGTTMAILTAGQNSLYKPDGTVDTAKSTQFLFLYDVEGPVGRAEQSLTVRPITPPGT